MMTANEARLKTEETIKNDLDLEMHNIELKIEEAIKQGKDIIDTPDISYQAKTLLKELGYNVSSGSHYNEYYCYVDWRTHND